jgi:hypothetical protein
LGASGLSNGVSGERDNLGNFCVRKGDSYAGRCDPSDPMKSGDGFGKEGVLDDDDDDENSGAGVELAVEFDGVDNNVGLGLTDFINTE